MPTSVSADAEGWLEARLRWRAVGFAVFAAIGVALLAWLIVWWIDEGRENDRLREVGVETDAIVVDRLTRLRAPRVRATIVEFTFDGVDYRERLNHGTRERVGQTIPILVDPADPSSIRALDEANIGPIVPIGAFLTAALAGLAAMAARSHLRARRILRGQAFHDGGLVVDNWRSRRGARRKLTLVAAGERYEIRGGIIGGRRGDLVAEAVYATDGRHVVAVIPDQRIAAFGRVFGASRLPPAEAGLG